MVDPLSPTASALAIASGALSASKKVYALIQSISNAPEELLSLSNEVESLRIMLASIELSLGRMGSSIEPTSILPTLLRRTEDKLRELQRFLGEFCTSTSKPVSKLKGLDWTLRGREKARKLQQELESLMSKVNNSLSTLSA
jgi:hypothetical protein